jgi:hypothetical protein
MERDRVRRQMEAMVTDLEELLDYHLTGDPLHGREDEFRVKAIGYRVFIACCKLPHRIGQDTYRKVMSMTVPEQEMWLMSNSPYLKPSSGKKPETVGGIRI